MKPPNVITPLQRPPKIVHIYRLIRYYVIAVVGVRRGLRGPPDAYLTRLLGKIEGRSGRVRTARRSNISAVWKFNTPPVMISGGCTGGARVQLH